MSLTYRGQKYIKKDEFSIKEKVLLTYRGKKYLR